MLSEQLNTDVEQSAGLGADLLMTTWILVVAFAYFAPVINPNLGRMPTLLAPVYAVMILLTVLSLSLRYSRHRESIKAAVADPPSGGVS